MNHKSIFATTIASRTTLPVLLSFLILSGRPSIAANIIATDYITSLVQQFNDQGAYVGSINPGLNGAYAVAARSGGGFVVAGYTDGDAKIFDSNGSLVSTFSALASTYDIAINRSNGEMYFSMIAPSLVQVYSSTGTLLRQLTLSGGDGQYTSIGPDGNLYAKDASGGLAQFNSITGALEAEVLTAVQIGGAFAGLAFDNQGRIIWSAGSNILRYDPVSASTKTLVSFVAGGEVRDLGVSVTGDVYYTDGNARLNQLTEAGVNTVLSTTGYLDRIAVLEGSSAVPEPLSFGLVGMWLGGLAMMLKRKRRQGESL